MLLITAFAQCWQICGVKISGLQSGAHAAELVSAIAATETASAAICGVCEAASISVCAASAEANCCEAAVAIRFTPSAAICASKSRGTAISGVTITENKKRFKRQCEQNRHSYVFYFKMERLTKTVDILYVYLENIRTYVALCFSYKIKRYEYF